MPLPAWPRTGAAMVAVMVVITISFFRDSEGGGHRKADEDLRPDRQQLVLPGGLNVHLEKDAARLHVVADGVADVGREADDAGDAVEAFRGCCRQTDLCRFGPDAHHAVM